MFCSRISRLTNSSSRFQAACIAGESWAGNRGRADDRMTMQTKPVAKKRGTRIKRSSCQMSLELRQAAVAVHAVGEEGQDGQTVRREPARHDHVGSGRRADRGAGASQSAPLLERLLVTDQDGVVQQR